MKPNLMGVINITPNSFSDGGHYADPQALRAQWRRLSLHCRMLDLGAESTAPMNAPIGAAEERTRFEAGLRVLEGEVGTEFLSIDTYRPETMAWVYARARELFPQSKIIWNDVSGVVDADLVGFFERHPACGYVLCHNRSPERETGARHMRHAQAGVGDVVSEVVDYFRRRLQALAPLRLKWVALDACLGFSKEAPESWALLNAAGALLREFPGQEWVWGLSRKSFLRKAAPEGVDPMAFAQHLEALHAQRIMREGHAPWWRVHDPAGILAAAICPL